MKYFGLAGLAVSMFMMVVIAVAVLGIIIGVLSPELHEAIMTFLKGKE